MIIDNRGYLSKRAQVRGVGGRSVRRNWHLVREVKGNNGIVSVNRIVVDKKYVGKRIRLKIIIEEVDMEEQNEIRKTKGRS